MAAALSGGNAAAVAVTSIFEKYRDIIDAGGTNPPGCLPGGASSTGGCKSPDSTHHLKHPLIDAGSGGTADGLAAEQGGPVEPAREIPLPIVRSPATVGSGSSGGTCGYEGGSDVEDSCSTSVQVSATDTTAAEKLGLASLVAAAEAETAAPPEKAACMPWTYSYFFDDEGF